ncbi:hypothetical protein EDM68_04575 [Candidatus Uhrbacteria bacterium]|nr:MAG: hypothetical protein EDM68_04575 [Candidatus Uhrbacteria bacterium]
MTDRSDRKSSTNNPIVTRSTDLGDPNIVETVRREDGVIVTTVSGEADPSSFEGVRHRVMTELDGRPACWLLDASRLKKFDREAVEPLVELLINLKARGGLRAVVIVSDPSVRMMLSSVSMQSVPSGGLPLECVESLRAANIRLRVSVEEAR